MNHLNIENFIVTVYGDVGQGRVEFELDYRRESYVHS